jgi:hypothetical protein
MTDTSTFRESMKPEKSSLLILGLLLVFTVLIRLPILAEPWGADQAGFGYVAKGMLQGKVPYKDMYSLTAYGIFFTFVLLFKLFGVKMASAHIGHLIVSIVTVILVYFLSNRLYGKKAALIAGISYTVFSNGLAFSAFGYENKSAWGTYWYLSQREVYMAPLLMGAVFLLILRNRKNGMFLDFINGLLIGLAAFYKLTAILMLLLFILVVAREEFIGMEKFHPLRIVGAIFFLLFGFTLIQLPFLYYFWVHDALKDVYQALFVHLSSYAKLSRGLRIETLFSGHYSVLKENLILWLFASISFLHILFRDRSRNNLLIALWALVSLAMVWGQGKFFGYHFILLVPPFAVLTGYGLPRFLASGSGWKEFLANNFSDITKTFMLVTVLLSLVGFGILNYDYYHRHVLFFMGKMSRQQYYDVFNEFPTHPYSFRSDYQIVQYLKKEAHPGEKLGVIFSAGDTVIHFLTGMEPATRFIQSWYLFTSDEALATNPITVKLRTEFVDELTHSAPRFILCVHIPLEKLVQIPSIKDDPSVLRLSTFVKTHYRLVTFPDNRFLFVKL